MSALSTFPDPPPATESSVISFVPPTTPTRASFGRIGTTTPSANRSTGFGRVLCFSPSTNAREGCREQRTAGRAAARGSALRVAYAWNAVVAASWMSADGVVLANEARASSSGEGNGSPRASAASYDADTARLNRSATGIRSCRTTSPGSG